MKPFLYFLLSRLAGILITLLIITALLYGMVMLAPAEERAMLYWPPRTRNNLPEEVVERIQARIIEEHGLNDPYFQQYTRWLSELLRGDWGWSPTHKEDVLSALLRRTPVTAELTLYSILVFIPLGLLTGVLAGWRETGRTAQVIQLGAYLGTAIPPFVLGLLLLSFFYVGLHWFPMGRTGIIEVSLVRSSSFKTITGLLTVDGLLNGRLDVTLDALRHLVLPVLTLSLVHWATLSRLTRTAMIQEKHRDYVMAARARGLLPRSIVWRHTFRNAALPALTSGALSVASLVTGVLVVEEIFNFNGLAALISHSMTGTPDAPLALGFAVFTALLVLPLLFVLDVVKVVVDPRIGAEMIGS